MHAHYAGLIAFVGGFDVNRCRQKRVELQVVGDLIDILVFFAGFRDKLRQIAELASASADPTIREAAARPPAAESRAS